MSFSYDFGPSNLLPFYISIIFYLISAATKWRDTTTGLHVEYDQRPDVFRSDLEFCLMFLWISKITSHVTLVLMIILSGCIIFSATGELFDMQVFTLILEGQEVVGMTWNHLLTHLFFCCVVDFHGKDIRWLY